MKSMNFKFAVPALFLLLFALSVRAQEIPTDPKYGATPEERKENVLRLNYLNDAYNNKNYNVAVKYIDELVAYAPKSSQNIYVYGINIYKNKIARAGSVEEKNVMIDSLMTMYDLRSQFFGDDQTRGRKYIAQAKATDYLNYRPSDREGVKRLLREAIELNGDETDPDLVDAYFQVLVEDYKKDLIETDELLKEYDLFSAFFERSTAPNKEEARKVFEALFISSGAASCENLEKIYAPQFKANPNDMELIEKVFGLLSRGNCGTAFQAELGEAYYKNKPASDVALMLARSFEELGDHAKARHYLNEAISRESDPVTKSKLATQIAAGELTQGNLRPAADFARQAIDMNPENGLAYVILGNAYGQAARGQCGEFEAMTVRWVVVDLLTRGRDLLTGEETSQVGAVNGMINSYSSGFPSKEELFYRGLDNGTPFTVNCGWISGRTTVRSRR